MNKKLQIILFILLTFALLFLAFNRHSKYKEYHYRSEIFADKAGYYVYLPALFIYNFKASEFPENIDQKVGNGFQIDSINNKVITKYTYGVALMQLPFFILAHFTSLVTGFDSNGFTFLYQKSVDVASIFYLLSGLYFLFILLKQRFSLKVSLITMLTVFLGTNLFYYSVIETGMSHVYSFSMFSVYLLLLSYHNKFIRQQLKFGLLLGLFAGIIVMLRPLNILFILFSFLLIPNVFKNKSFVNYPILILSFAFAGFLTILPQMLYWNFISGSFLYYSYGSESFSNIANPQILELFLAPNNGHVLYNPIFLLFVAGIILMIINKDRNGWIIGILILVLSYLISSWWIYNFGCGFANRNFAEYYALLAFPLAYLLNKPKARSIQAGVYLLILIFSIYNIKMALSFDGCWYGIGNWDWRMYMHWLLNAPS